MTFNGYFSSVEALEFLGLYNPASGRKPNTRHLKSLNRRGLLKRLQVGDRTILYKRTECEKLLKKVELEGISLTTKS